MDLDENRWASGAPVEAETEPAQPGEPGRPSRAQPRPLRDAAPASLVARDRARILVVDDDDDQREQIAALLRDRYAVETAADGLAALAVAALRKPDLLLCDVIMGGLDGFGLARAFRADAALCHVPVIFLSARADEDSVVTGLETGADDYIIKPFSPRELLARVRTHLELVQQREVFARFFGLSLDLMCIAGVDGYFRLLSPGFSALGYSPEELLSRPFLDFVHPDDVRATLAELEKLSRNIPTLRFDNRYRCKDGRYRWLSWTCAPDASGTLYAVARDITDAKQTEAELTRAKTAAEAASRDLVSFSYSVAHDLRAPLRSIDGFSQALLEDYAETLDETGKKYLSFLRESAQKMAELIDDLLALSRVTLSELRYERVDLTALARAALSRLQRGEPGRQVVAVIQDGMETEADPRLLAVVLDNLLGNAWRFTGKRAVAHIEFGTTAIDGEPVYFVADDGAGFDMAFSHKLFGVFQRLHTDSEFPGTGIGLATVRRVVERHDGRVWGEGEVGRGATFYFTLPPKRRGP